MNATVETLYFSGAQIPEKDLIAVTDPDRGYPVTHLLAKHLIWIGGQCDRLDFYFSKELVRVKGKDLNRLWEILVKGEPLISDVPDVPGYRVDHITVLPSDNSPDSNDTGKEQ